MEKLISLINEYENLNMGRKFDSYDEEEHIFMSNDLVDVLLEDTVISKKYGFIKWLYKNNHIDQNLLERVAIDYFTDESPIYSNAVWIERLIMILSVSDNPISYLCQYLE